MKKVLLVLLTASCFLLQGCIGMRSNSLAMVSPETIKFAAPAKTRVYTRWKLDTQAKLNDQMKVAAIAVNKKKFDDALTGTGCCVIVEAQSDAQVVVDGTTHDHFNRAAMLPAFLTGFTFGALPSWATASPHCSVSVNANGKTTTYEARDSMTMVTWLPLIVGFPFANPFKAEKEITDNVYNTLIAGMKKDGVLGQ